MPHLLKCTHNLVLKHDEANLEFEITANDHLTGSTKQEEILKVYEVDRCIVQRLLLKVSKRHMKPCALNSVKVSLSVPVVSSTAAAVNTLVTVDKDNYTVSLNDMQAYQQCCYVVLVFVTILKAV